MVLHRQNHNSVEKWKKKIFPIFYFSRPLLGKQGKDSLVPEEHSLRHDLIHEIRVRGHDPMVLVDHVYALVPHLAFSIEVV